MVSPLSYTEREYNTIDDVWDEIDKIAEINARTDRTIGQDLFHLVPIFTNPHYVMNPEDSNLINEFNMCKNFNVSLGNLFEIPSSMLNAFTVIQNEYNAIAQFGRQKNGKK